MVNLEADWWRKKFEERRQRKGIADVRRPWQFVTNASVTESDTTWKMPKSKAAVKDEADLSGSDAASEGPSTTSKKRQLDEVCQFFNYSISAAFPECWPLSSQMNKSPKKPKQKQKMALYARFYVLCAYLIWLTGGRTQGASSRQNYYDRFRRAICRPRQEETRYSAVVQGRCLTGYTWILWCRWSREAWKEGDIAHIGTGRAFAISSSYKFTSYLQWEALRESANSIDQFFSTQKKKWRISMDDICITIVSWLLRLRYLIRKLHRVPLSLVSIHAPFLFTNVMQSMTASITESCA